MLNKSIALAKVASSLASAGEYDRSLEIVSGMMMPPVEHSPFFNSINPFSFGEKDKAKMCSRQLLG